MDKQNYNGNDVPNQSKLGTDHPVENYLVYLVLRVDTDLMVHNRLVVLKNRLVKRHENKRSHSDDIPS